MSSPRPDPPAPDIATLLAAAGAGDEDAWRSLVGLYWRRVYALVHSRCGVADVAEEVTQSVFVTIAERLGAGDYDERGRFESWLFLIATNRMRDELRRRNRAPGTTDSDVLAAIPAIDRDAATRGAEDRFSPLRDALKTLNSADREIIELRHHAGLSFARIADLLGEPLGTLLARHHRALRKIRDAMTEQASPLTGSGES